MPRYLMKMSSRLANLQLLRSHNYWPTSFRQSSMDELFTAAQTWMDLDPEHAGILAKEISAARREEDWAISALTARFAGYLTFGTAGLRAPVGPGTTRMNRVVVQQAAAGIADFAHERVRDRKSVV